MRYSMIVPIYGDGALANAFCLEFARVFQAYLRTDDIAEAVELIFVNDGSPNDSLDHLQKVSQVHRFVRVVGLSRNFGQHAALAAGFAHARGEYVGSINVDMEDPPDQIPLLLAEFEKTECDIVFGLRRERHSPWLVKVTSTLFHWVLKSLTGYQYPSNIATLRIMSRRFTEAYLRFGEKAPFLDGLQFWLGFKRAFVPIAHQERAQGRSSYNFRRRFLMAMDSIISFSDLPLRLTVVAGAIVAACGFIYALVVIYLRLFVNVQAGYSSLVSIIMILGGVQILVIGLASLYIGRILKEVQNRPLYVVREKFGFKEVTVPRPN